MNLVERIEAALFVADGPLSANQMARVLDVTEGQIEQAIEVLEKRLSDRGALQVVRLAGGYQLSTRPEHATVIAAFLQPQRNKLSRSLLETLAIVAYRQPISMAEIEGIRGVQCDYAVRGLLDRRLIHEVGRKPTPGRPMLFGTTKDFLHHFRMHDLSELPKLSDAPLVAAQSSGERSLFDAEPNEVH